MQTQYPNKSTTNAGKYIAYSNVYYNQTNFSLQKLYCVLWGTLLLDYENEEDAKTTLSPKSSMELIGVSDWNATSQTPNYCNTNHPKALIKCLNINEIIYV